ncbi:hypothetical protein ACO0K9_24775 [Undibacterium sp. Ji50W]|uniref:hypothetical protein n=1 Tax=Undibacterium sp. Ji50W TaxID=3413041 RepID=UPI003BF15757
MKFHTLCPNCAIETPNNVTLGSIIFNDSGVYEFQCNNNHVSNIILQEEQFQVLFEIGIDSLATEHPIEAIVAFAASLERYYEYSIKVMTSEKCIDLAESKASWQAMGKFSERRLGAFIFTFLLTLNCTPKTLRNKLIELRNEIVHNGKIPTAQEALEYGQGVLEVIVHNYKISTERLNNAISKLRFENFEVSKEKTNKDAYCTLHSSIGSAITRVMESKDNVKPTLNEFVESAKEKINRYSKLAVPFKQTDKKIK